VVLCQSVAGVAPLIGHFCQIERCLNSFVRRFADAYWGLIKDGEFQTFLPMFGVIWGSITNGYRNSRAG